MKMTRTSEEINPTLPAENEEIEKTNSQSLRQDESIKRVMEVFSTTTQVCE
jgi:hypothetical protein